MHSLAVAAICCSPFHFPCTSTVKTDYWFAMQAQVRNRSTIPFKLRLLVERGLVKQLDNAEKD